MASLADCRVQSAMNSFSAPDKQHVGGRRSGSVEWPPADEVNPRSRKQLVVDQHHGIVEFRIVAEQPNRRYAGIIVGLAVTVCIPMFPCRPPPHPRPLPSHTWACLLMSAPTIRLRFKSRSSSCN